MTATRAEARREQQRFSRFSPAGIAISALLLWWALHNVSFGEAWNQLAGIRIVPFIGMVLLATARYPLVTVQWRYILRADGEPLPFVPLWHATAIGFMANNVLPARTGEFARAYAARQLSAVSFSTALASVAVEHILSGIVLVTMLAVGIWAGGFADGVVIGGMTLGRLARGAGLLVGLALLAAIIIVRWPTPARRMASKIATFLLPARYAEKVEAFAAGLLDGLRVLTSPRQSTVVMFWNWAVWLVSAGATWCALLAFNIDVPWSAVFLLQGVLGLVGAIGVIGAFEAVTKFALVLYAVDATQAVSSAVVWHVSTYLPITVLGLWSLSANQLRLRDFASWGTAGTTTERSRRMRIDELVQPDSTEPPAGSAVQRSMSTLMSAIHIAVDATAHNGSVSRESVLTSGRPRHTAYVDGREIFALVREELLSTKREFLFQTYVWQGGHDPEREILLTLQELERNRRARRAREPVQVRLLIGLSLGCARAVERWLFRQVEPDRARGEAAEQKIRALGLDPTLVNVEVAYYPSWLFGNFHCKGFIKDQRAVVFSGANVQDCHDYDDPWYEVAVLAEGDIATAARQDYVDSWSRSYYSWPLARTKPLPPVTRGVVWGDRGEVPMLFASRLARETFVGATGQNPWSTSLLAAIRNAGTRIRLLYPNLTVSEVTRSLIDAVHRGVRVELVLSKGFNQERLLLPFQEGTNDAVVRGLLERLQAQPPAKRDGGSLDLRWYSKDGRIPTEGTEKGASHAKYASFDGQVAIVGAGQPDHQSWYHSRENNVVVDCAAATRAWDAKVFEPAFHRSIRIHGLT